jgi:hypothetical protein
MIEAEYKMRFQLLTEEEELAAYKVDLNLNGPNPDQLMKCGTELMQKSQEMLQVRGYSGWRIAKQSIHPQIN